MTFAIPFAIVLMLGAIGITRQAWRDEHATYWAATLQWSEFWHRMSEVDIVLAPYYVFMRGWIAVFGSSVISMRVPSLLAMATAAGLTGLLAARLLTPWIGITSGALLAVLPSVSRYAEEARPYAFAMCFAVATILALVSRRWVLLGIFVALTGLSHLIALTVLFAHIPLIRGAWRAWGLAVGLGVLPVVPIVAIGARQTGQLDWIEPGWRSLAMFPAMLSRSAVVAGVLAGLALLAILTARPIAWLLLWALAPPAFVFIVANDFFYYRYLLFTLPAWAILAALGFCTAVKERQALATTALCLTVLVLGVRDHAALRRSPLPGDQDYASAAAHVRDRLQPGDSILFAGYPDQRERFGFGYELRGQPQPALCAAATECGPRLWLVTDGDPVIPAGYTVAEERRFAGIGLWLLRRG